MRLKIKENAGELYYSALRAKGMWKNRGFTKEENKFGEMIKRIEGKWIDVETDYLWDDQYNTTPIEGVSENGLRILDFEDEREYSIIEEIEDDERLKRDKCPICEHYERSSKYPSRRETGKCWWCDK